MSVKKIFMTLIIVVACVVIGALVLNVIMPNATKAVINAVEGQIQNATGMDFDFNGDGVTGSDGDGQTYTDSESSDTDVDGATGDGVGVDGIE